MIDNNVGWQPIGLLSDFFSKYQAFKCINSFLEPENIIVDTKVGFLAPIRRKIWGTYDLCYFSWRPYWFLAYLYYRHGNFKSINMHMPRKHNHYSENISLDTKVNLIITYNKEVTGIIQAAMSVRGNFVFSL